MSAPSTLDRRIDARFERIGRWLVERRWLALALTAIVTLVAAAQLPRLSIVTANEYLFEDDDPLLADYEAFKERFGNDEFLFLVADLGRVYTTESLGWLARLSDAIEEQVPHVRRVTTLLDVETVTTDPGDEDAIVVVPFVDRDAIPTDEAALEALARRAHARDDLTQLFVTADGRHAGVLVELEAADGEYRIAVSDAVHELLADPGFAGRTIHAAGAPLLDTALQTTVTADTRALARWSLLLTIAMLAWMFRRTIDVVAPSLVVLPAIVWVLGAMSFLGVPLTMLSMTIPALVTAVGVGDAVHVLAEYRAQAAERRSAREATIAAIRTTGLPCLFTTMTTMVGFGSLMAMEIRPGKEMGLFAAVGVGVALLLTFLVLPPILSMGSVARLREASREGGTRRARAWLARVAEVPIRAPRRVVAAGVVIALTSLYGITQLRVEADFIRLFERGHPVRVSFERIEATLGGTASMEVQVDAGETDGLLEPAVLADVASLEAWLRSHSEVRSVQSYLGPLADLSEALHDDPAMHRPPESRALAAQLFLLYEMGGGEDVERFVTPDRRVARVTARMPQLSTARFNEIDREIRAFAEVQVESASVTVSGEVPLLAGLFHRITVSQIRSFGLAFVAILGMMIVLFRSLRFGLLAMVPNVAPILVTLGFMGFAGIALNLGTMLIASISIGIAVDDTIHFVTHYRRHRRGGLSVEDAIRSAIAGVGQALLTTSLVLAAGYSVFVLASFAHLQNFGLLTAMTVSLALAADFLLLPALLLLLEPRARA